MCKWCNVVQTCTNRMSSFHFWYSFLLLWRRCEAWTRPAGIQATREAAGYQCLEAWAGCVDSLFWLLSFCQTTPKCNHTVLCWITWRSVGTECRTVGLSCQDTLSVSPSPFTLWHHILSSDCASVNLCLFPKSFPLIFGVLVFLHVAPNEKFNID